MSEICSFCCEGKSCAVYKKSAGIICQECLILAAQEIARDNRGFGPDKLADTMASPEWEVLMRGLKRKAELSRFMKRSYPDE